MVKSYYYCAKCKEWYKEEDCVRMGKNYYVCSECLGGIYPCFKIMRKYSDSKTGKRKFFDFCEDCDNRFICLTGGK